MFDTKVKNFKIGLSKVIDHWKILIMSKDKNEKVLIFKLKIIKILQRRADLGDPDIETESWRNNTSESQKKLLT